MGTDIHGVFQKRTEKGWEDVPSKYEENRHYFLFSVLADVRNGYGFAGVPTYGPVEPIAQPRGLPKDFLMEGDVHPVDSLGLMGWRAKYRGDNEPLAVWMGDHSHSWLTGKEILAYAKKQGKKESVEQGVLSVEEYSKWDRVNRPSAFCRGISGPRIVISEPSNINENTTHVKITWKHSYLEEIDYFIEEVKRLQSEHGEIRFVFGFDS